MKIELDLRSGAERPETVGHKLWIGAFGDCFIAIWDGKEFTKWGGSHLKVPRAWADLDTGMLHEAAKSLGR